jgi:hypothetical protein
VSSLNHGLLENNLAASELRLGHLIVVRVFRMSKSAEAVPKLRCGKLEALVALATDWKRATAYSKLIANDRLNKFFNP